MGRHLKTAVKSEIKARLLAANSEAQLTTIKIGEQTFRCKIYKTGSQYHIHVNGKHLMDDSLERISEMSAGELTNAD